MAGKDAREGFWLRAKRQNGGKGRLGRKWESPEGNLYCSTIVELRASDPAPSSLSFVVGLAVYDLLRGQLNDDTTMMLKWPNDILVNNAKICGILLERVKASIIVGIGVNISVAPDLPDRKTISLNIANDRNTKDAEQILEALLPLFQRRVSQWRGEGVKSILNDWQIRAHPLGTELFVSDAEGNRISGKYCGLTDEGALRLRKLDGALIDIHAGDISLA